MALMQNYEAIAREIDVLMAEAAALNSSGPHFMIVHRCREGACIHCEVVSVALEYRSRRFFLKISATEALLFEALARTATHYFQNATQIAAFVHDNRLFPKRGGTSRGPRGLSRTTIKTHVMRLRSALGIAFAETGLQLAPAEVLRTEYTTGPIGYQLHGHVEWVHLTDGSC